MLLFIIWIKVNVIEVLFYQTCLKYHYSFPNVNVLLKWWFPLHWDGLLYRFGVKMDFLVIVFMIGGGFHVRFLVVSRHVRKFRKNTRIFILQTKVDP